MRKVCLIGLLCALFMAAKTAGADVLQLSNKNTIDGTLLEATPLSILFLPPFSKNPMEIPWTEVISLETDADYNLRISTGEQLMGDLSYSRKKGLQMTSAALGRQTFELAQIRAISPATPNDGSETENKINNENVKIDNAVAANKEPENTYGTETKEPPVTFLRGSTVLLSPGQIEGRIGFSYAPEFSANGYTNFKQRTFTTSLNLNVGIMDNLEAWINVPFAYIRARQESAFDTTGRESAWDFKDISLGANAVLFYETDSLPEVSLTASVKIPTGQESYDTEHIYYSGDGHWRGSLGLNFVKSLDPAIIYMGAAVGYNWPYENYGYEYEYDLDYSYYFGLGMAINDKLSFSSRVEGAYQPALKFDGNREGRWSTDPMYASFGFAYRLSQKTVLEPQIAFGINEDAASSQFSISVSRKFN